jgi:predicted N-acyltransferase
MTRSHDVEISTSGDLSTVSAAEWDALITETDSPFVRYAWLKSLEDAGCVTPDVGWMPQHVLVRREGKLVAAAPAYVKGNSEGEFVFDYQWERFAERIGVQYLPKLIVAVPFTPATGRRLLVSPSEPREMYARVLGKGIHAVAQKLGVSSAHVLFPNDEDVESLSITGYARRDGIQFHWRNQGYQTYADFLASFNSKRRHQLKRERREVEESGIVVRTFRGKDIGEEELDAMERFYLDTVDKHYPWTRRYLNRRFFELVIERMGDAIEIVLAKEGARYIAGAFNVSGGKRLYGRYWGATETRPFLHFHVCYYHSIDECIQRGIEVFEPGAGGEHKLPRGFSPTATHSAHLLFDPRLDVAIRQHLVAERKAVAEMIERGEE